MILGVIADDFTGATDVASMLVRAGMRTVQVIGVPAGAAPRGRRGGGGAEVAHHAGGRRGGASRWRRCAGCRRPVRASSTSSTARPSIPPPTGNIGPVADALMDALGSDFTIACPAFPENGRTVFRGHLFVGDQLLSDSGMRDHPLTPMTDANLVRVLQAQTPARSACCATTSWRKGVGVRGAHRLRCAPTAFGWRSPMPSTNDDLRALARGLRRAAADHRRLGRRARPARGLCGTGLAAARCAGRRAAGGRAVLRRCCRAPARWPPTPRCSTGWQPGRPALRDRRARAGTRRAGRRSRRWPGRAERLAQGPVLIYATAEPPQVKAVQAELGVERAGQLVEALPGRRSRRAWSTRACAGWWSPAARPRARWCRRWACRRCASAPRSTPACPGPRRERQRPLLLALKSGNFGGVDFFAKALAPGAHELVDHAALRAEICRVGRSLFERGYVHATAGNISVRLPERRRFPDHAHRRLPGLSAARAAGPVGAGRHAAQRRPRQQDAGAAPPHLRQRARCALRDPHPQHAPGRADAGRRLERGRHRAADHALLRDEGRPCAADPLPPPGRPGGGRGGGRARSEPRATAACRSAR